MMILVFEFNTRASHGVLEGFLANIVASFNLPLDLRREKEALCLFVKKEEELLLKFSDFLSQMLPVSIFVQGFKVSVVEKPYGIPIALKSCELFLPFSPQMAKSVIDEKSSDFYNPFIVPSVGIGLEAKEILTFRIKENSFSSQKEGFKPLFEMAAGEIASGKSVRVKTATGDWFLEAVNEKSKFKNIDELIIMPCDLSVVEKMVVIKSSQMQALGAIEKPQLRLPVNAIYAQKEILQERFVSMRLADDILLFLLTRELYAKGIEFIALRATGEAEAHLTYEDGNIREPLYVSVLENGQSLILKDSTYTPKNLIKNLNSFDTPSTKQSATLLKEFDLLDKSVVCVYLSKEHSDEILVYSNESGMIDLAYFDFENSGQELIDEIRKSEKGKVLVENFSNAFPETFQAFCELDLSSSPKNLYTIFGAVGVLFGFEKTLEKAAKTLLDNATLFSGLKGPRIDYLQIGDSLRAKIDALRLIRSGMSYHLAGLDALTLSYGYIDSLGYFISDSLDKIKEEFNTTHLALSGNLFENSRLSEIAARHSKITHTVCFNREFPIDI